MRFYDLLREAQERNRSLLCCGLDPDPAHLPGCLPNDAETAIAKFNQDIIESVEDIVCAFKPNFAFYEAEGEAGYRALCATMEAIPEDIPAIADAKRGDIGNTARAYARAVFEHLSFDAVTVNPYMGSDSVWPFLEYEDKGVFLLCLTSNPGSADFQRHDDLYLRVAEKAAAWNEETGNIGLVVGAQHPEELRKIRSIVGDMPILVPGVGTQGGDAAEVLKAGLTEEGRGVIINVSRAILYASDQHDYAEKAREAAMDYVRMMRENAFQ